MDKQTDGKRSNTEEQGNREDNVEKVHIEKESETQKEEGHDRRERMHSVKQLTVSKQRVLSEE